MKYLLLFSFIVLLSITVGCSDDTEDTSQIIELTQQEKEDILFMREEEKLARDVYLYAYDVYGEKIFYNIATKAEQSHMDKILTLIKKYDLTDPASPDRGVFTDGELQGLYNELTQKVDLSLEEALIVGATIEDLDIRDLEMCDNSTDKLDILAVYGALKCGSRNHMRSFDNQLSILGVNYTAQFITQEEYDEIVNSTSEKCGQ